MSYVEAVHNATFALYFSYERHREPLAVRETPRGIVLVRARLPDDLDDTPSYARVEVGLDRAEEAGEYAPAEVAAFLADGATGDGHWIEAMAFATHFDWPDIAEVIATSDGDHDADPWLGLFRLRDGRFGRLSAGCAYSGWDVWGGGDSAVADSMEELVTLCMSPDERDRLRETAIARGYAATLW